MKKQLIRFFALLLVCTVIMSMAQHGLAVGSPWLERIKTFQWISVADVGRYPGYTKTLQRFLSCYSTDYYNQLSNYGASNPVDGVFGTKTSTITKSYQEAKGLVNSQGVGDGIVGPNTWGAIAGDLTLLNIYATYATVHRFSVNGSAVMDVLPTETGFDYYYYLSSGRGSVFHTT